MKIKKLAAFATAFVMSISFFPSINAHASEAQNQQDVLYDD